MPIKKPGYKQQFAVKYPEVDEVDPGTVFTGEKVAKLTDVLDRKIADLSRKPALSARETRFVDTMVDLGSRNIIYLVDRGSQVPAEAADGLIKSANNLTGSLGSEVGDVQSKMTSALTRVSHGGASVESNPHLRGRAEDFARVVVSSFGEMANAAETAGSPIVVDSYLETNLSQIISRYEMADDEYHAPQIGRTAIQP